MSITPPSPPTSLFPSAPFPSKMTISSAQFIFSLHPSQSSFYFPIAQPGLRCSLQEVPCPAANALLRVLVGAFAARTH